MTAAIGPLATRDRCLCLCHGPHGVDRWMPGGCGECALIHPPGEGMAVWDEPDASDEVAEALAIVEQIEELPMERTA